ncbi:MAG TPA: hypothetical protein VLE48_11515, partial [Terriglobales bacterium]|nr:hypothetical protein [Terriglobales bacterium]
VYKIPGRDGPEFPREVVLNHRKQVRKGVPISGLLLGVGYKPIPKKYPHGTMVDARLCVTDELGNRSTALVSFWVDRAVELISKNKTSRRSLPCLFDGNELRSRLDEPPTTEARGSKADSKDR